jgi:predicted house-cleaning noncanonical NTP pyrophosphatase (MazG superfamily)
MSKKKNSPNKMLKDKKLLLAGGGVVVVALVIGGYLMKSKQGPMEKIQKKMDGKIAQYSEKNPFQGGFQAAAALGVPMKCTYKAGEMEYQGKIKGEKFRGEITMADGQTGHIIFKDNCMYSWSDDQKDMGFKMCDMEEFAEDLTENMDEEMVDYQQNKGQNNLPDNLKCYPAAVSDSDFETPSDVTFKDFGGMMDEFSQGMEDYMPTAEQMEGMEEMPGMGMEEMPEMPAEMMQYME